MFQFLSSECAIVHCTNVTFLADVHSTFGDTERALLRRDANGLKVGTSVKKRQTALRERERERVKSIRRIVIEG